MRALKITRIAAALKLGRTVPELIARAKTIASEIAANPTLFKAPNPTAAVFNAHISDVEVAQAAIATRAPGTVEIRDAKVRVLIDDLHTVKTYVEGIANVDVGDAPSTIRAAGLMVRKVNPPIKQDLAVKHGAASGSVTIIAKAAARRASYDWQWSLDQKLWTDVPQTLQARTSLPDLALGVVHYFRYRAVTKSGVGDWSQIVSLIVT